MIGFEASAGAATVVERMRVHGSGADALTARLRLEHRLAGADLRPAGMPSAAVLCVRELADPLPGGLGVDGPAADARPWEEACRARLGRILRGAARPAHEPVPAGAEAVLFSDQAELLACLARDSVAGVAWTHWWWRRARARAGAGRDPAVQAWLEAPAHGPAALELLAARGDALPFVAWMTEAQARVLSMRIAQAFGASSLQAVSAGLSAAAGRVARFERDRPGRISPPWRELVPETRTVALASGGELLLGVALSLRRAPSRARSRQFAEGVAAWLQSGAGRSEAGPSWGVTGAPRSATVAARSRSAEVLPDRSAGTARDCGAGVLAEPEPLRGPGSSGAVRRPVPGRAAPSPDAVDVGATGLPLDESPSLAHAQAQATSAPSRRARGAVRVAVVDPQAARPPVSTGSGTTRAAAVHRSPAIARTPVPSVRPASGSRAGLSAGAGATPRAGVGLPARPGAARAPAVEIQSDRFPAVTETSLGGVFYLLNLLTALGLYGDFTTPQEPGIDLDPWDCLTLLARRLLGRPAPRDPVWTLLARLAGRENRAAPPGTDFKPPRRWRVPPEWLAPFPAGGLWRWSAARGTLQIVHPAGFPAVAVPRDAAAPAEQFRREWRRLSPPRSTAMARRAALLRAEPQDPLARWVARLAAYSEARLRLALGVEAEQSLAGLLFEHQARVALTPTHVEVTLRLATLPLAVRFAGLDRTPGWLPAAGRFVAFEFE